MGISSSALATLVIAGTAIGGTAIAVVANNAQADVKSSNISQVVADPKVNPTNPTGTISNGSNNDVGTIQNVTPTTSPTASAPTPKPVVPPTTPPNYGGSGNGDDNGYDDGDSNEGLDDDEGSDD